MQVSVETTSGLERRMTVQLPAERVDQEVDNRLKSLARTARLDGFRPGKIPMRVIKQRYGKQVELEVANDLIGSSYQEAISQENLHPAAGPKIEPKPINAGEGLEYTAIFEVMPEIDPAGLDGVEVEKPVSEINDSDIDAMLEKLRQQRASWEDVQRAAAKGDQVTIDFKGTIDGEAFEGGSGEDMKIELGSGRMIPGFEDGLIGAKPGDEVSLDLQFPEDYHNQELAGKATNFAVTVKAVAAAKLPEIDEDFVKSLGVGDGTVAALRDEVRKNMERELQNALKIVVKDRAFDKLLETNKIDIPESMVNEEADRLANEMYQSIGGNNQGINLPRDLFRDKAERRVSLGLLIGELVKKNGIQVDPERVKATVESIAASYENPAEVIEWYTKNQEAMASAHSLAMEEQVVDWLLEQAKVVEKPCTFDEIIEMRQASNR